MHVDDLVQCLLFTSAVPIRYFHPYAVISSNANHAGLGQYLGQHYLHMPALHVQFVHAFRHRAAYPLTALT